MSRPTCSLATVKDCGGSQPGCVGECQGHVAPVCMRLARYRLEDDLLLQYACDNHLLLLQWRSPEATMTALSGARA